MCFGCMPVVMRDKKKKKCRSGWIMNNDSCYCTTLFLMLKYEWLIKESNEDDEKVKWLLEIYSDKYMNFGTNDWCN